MFLQRVLPIDAQLAGRSFGSTSQHAVGHSSIKWLQEVGVALGSGEGKGDGRSVGPGDGTGEGRSVGRLDGTEDGKVDGLADGTGEGNGVGLQSIRS